MRPRHYARILRDKIKFASFKVQTLMSSAPRFDCPVCHYSGPFMSLNPPTGLRRHARCPSCGALERHRLEHLAISAALTARDASTMRMLHFAPESFFRPLFYGQFQDYESADLNMTDVDCRVDVQDLPFADNSYDFVLASIVLDYVRDDTKAIGEIRRILKPGGIAVLPVALVCEKTIEYAEPNPNEANHVRASGMDYFERYQPYFSKVDRVSSQSFPEKYQLFVYEDRSVWPNDKCPLRPPMFGEKHVNIVPVCYV